MRWRRLLIILAVCAAAIALVLALIPREPRYDGRALSEWIRDSAPRPSPEPETTRAVAAVRHIGTNGLPWLIKWISYQSPPGWKLKLIAASEKLPGWIRAGIVTQLLGERSYETRRRLALDGFLILGPAASPAVPDLLQMTDSTSSSSPATGALESIGLASLAPTLSALTNRANAPALRAAAADWIRILEPEFDCGPIVPVLAECVRERNPVVAKAAARALVRSGAETELTVQFFIKLLQSGDVLGRCDAAENLSVLRDKARRAVPALLIALNDSDWYVRKEATKALYWIEPDALEKAIPGSVAAIKAANLGESSRW